MRWQFSFVVGLKPDFAVCGGIKTPSISSDCWIAAGEPEPGQNLQGIMAFTAWKVVGDQFLITDDRNSVLDSTISDIGDLKENPQGPQPQQMIETKEQPETVQMKLENEETGPVQIIEEQKETEPVQMTETKVESEPLGTKVEEEEPEPEQIKEEQKEIEPKEEPEYQLINEKLVELGFFEDEGQLLVKQETRTSMVTLVPEEIFHSGPELQPIMETMEESDYPRVKIEKEEPEPLQIKAEQNETGPIQTTKIKEEPEHWPINEDQTEIFQDGGQLLMQQETGSFILTPTVDLLCSNSSTAATQHQEGSIPQHSSSNKDKYPKPEKRCKKSRKQGDNVDNSKLRPKKKSCFCKVCGRGFTSRQCLTLHTRTHTGRRKALSLFLTEMQKKQAVKRAQRDEHMQLRLREAQEAREHEASFAREATARAAAFARDRAERTAALHREQRAQAAAFIQAFLVVLGDLVHAVGERHA
ncbi:zinc finger and SCAN domain-containing protein 21 isoform X6 [Fundulus heteroclitus]|uniref:zinc finger and SCAN domain-containing protein 21 isoform X6 n=1 Tax=Fundulus heteroclitus TaxID=8078 RepID=UPI00165C2445|nr:zinc finger and SCAN domain-containing protein 21 isoform X6 [Fundulus heteroclitus]